MPGWIEKGDKSCKIAQEITLFPVFEMYLDSNVRDVNYLAELFRGFLQSLQANSRISSTSN
jgi:hypothetical protein